MDEIKYQENQEDSEIVEEISGGQQPILHKKKPNFIWMAGTLVFLLAAILEFYSLSTAAAIPTPAQYLSNQTISLAQGANINMTQLNLEYHQEVNNRTKYELGSLVVVIALSMLTVKNFWYKLKKD